jgi:UPF0755 protein
MNDLGIFQEPPNGHLPEERFGRRAQRSKRKRQRRKRAGGRAAVLFALAFLVAIVGVAGVFGYAWLDDQLHPPDYPGTGDGSVTLQIRNGEFASVYAVRMQQEKIVKSSRAFVKAANKDPRTGSIQPGYYQMRLHMSAASALALLLDPKSRAGTQIVIPEGLRAAKVYERLSAKTGIPVADFKAAAKDGASLGLPSYAKGNVEGYLYPGLYALKPNSTAKDLLTLMVAQFNQVAQNDDLAGLAAKARLSTADLITKASLVQAESGRTSDMPKIARVIDNRLARHMRLGFDSTTLYGLGKFGIVASSQDLKSTSPYNTYRVFGLPPGPICAPSEAAIQAAASPAPGTWLYFVATDPANHVTEFATTDKDFQHLKDKLNAYLKAHPNG